METTIAFEDSVTSFDADARGDALWVRPDGLARTLGWEVKPEGLCRGPICLPLPPENRAELVRPDGAVDLAALARLRGQAVAHDGGRTVWVFGPAAETGGARSVLAPDFTLPDLAGQPYTLSAFRGRKVLLNSWASW